MIKRPSMSLRLLTCHSMDTKQKPPPAPTGTPRNKQQDKIGYSKRDTKSNGNRLVLILKEVEPQKYLPKMMSPTMNADVGARGYTNPRPSKIETFITVKHHTVHLGGRS